VQSKIKMINGELFYDGRPVKEISPEEREQMVNQAAARLRAGIEKLRANG
jgi:predicted nuclease of restriction endonuclease-like RecB superfamily